MNASLCLIILVVTIKRNSGHLVQNLTECPSTVSRNQELKVYVGQCLQFVMTETSWTSAKTDCSSRGGNLVMIKNAGKQTFIYNTLRSLHWKYNCVWIGASDSDKEGSWVWVDGTPVSYGNWNPGEGPTHQGFFFSPPSKNDCALLRFDDDGRWRDYPCGGYGYHYSYICEYHLESGVGTSSLSLMIYKAKPVI